MNANANTHKVLLNVVCEELGLKGYSAKHPLKQFEEIVDAFKEIQVNLTETDWRNQLVFEKLEINRCKDAELFVAMYKKINQLQMQGKKEEEIMELAVYPRIREMLESNKDLTIILNEKINFHKESYNEKVSERMDKTLKDLNLYDLFKDGEQCLELKQEVINITIPNKAMKV